MSTQKGMQVGVGHGGNSRLPALQEVTNTARFQRMAHLLQPGSKGYQLGRCLVLLSPPFDGKGWHMSISHPDRYPTWDEVAKARYDLIPNEAQMVMHLPPREDYVNIHNFCFQLMELIGTDSGEQHP